MMIDKAAARTLSRKRGGVKPSKKFRPFKVVYDEYGALILPTEEIEFDMELSNKLHKEYTDALDAQNKREAEEARAQKEQDDATNKPTVGTSEKNNISEDTQSDGVSTSEDSNGETPTD